MRIVSRRAANPSLQRSPHNALATLRDRIGEDKGDCDYSEDGRQQNVGYDQSQLRPRLGGSCRAKAHGFHEWQGDANAGCLRKLFADPPDRNEYGAALYARLEPIEIDNICGH
jgi:hypothetical protein